MKRLLILSFSILIAFSLTACLEETNTIEINKNGGTAIHEQVITKEVYDQLIEMGSNPDEFNEEGYEITTFKKDDTEYVKGIKKYSFNSLEQLERYFTELATSDEGSNSEVYFKSFKINCKNDNITITGEIGKPDAATVYTSCVVIIKFENEITEFNIGETINDRTLKIDMLDSWKNKPGKEFKIISEKDNIPLWPFIVGGVTVILIIGGLLAVLLIKKKKSTSNERQEIL